MIKTVLKEAVFYEYPGIDQLFYRIWSIFYFSDRAVGIFELTGISGGGDHAACRDLGSKRRDRISDGNAFIRSGRACRKLGAVSAGAARRNEGDGILFPEISEAAAGHRGQDADAQGKGMHWCVCEQTAPDGADDHFHSGGNGADGFHQIYGQFCMRDFYLESCVCRSRIFLRRDGDPDSGIAGRNENEDCNAYQ